MPNTAKTHPHFLANARLKDVVGRDLINDDNVALIELIKNAKDAGSGAVTIHFGNIPDRNAPPSILISDTGKGMSEEDIRFKWLNIAYSEKRDTSLRRSQRYAGNKGIGRFSCDRLGSRLVLYTRCKAGDLFRLEIDWTKFEVDDRDRQIGKIPTTLEIIDASRLTAETTLKRFSTGTVLHIHDLRSSWSKDRLHRLRRELEKFVVDPSRSFTVALRVDSHKNDAKLNGVVENKIFDKLSFRTTSIHSHVNASGDSIETSLVHDGATLFTMKEKNPYGSLRGTRISLFYLNQPAKAFFKVHTGYRSVEFGSVFLFLNGFRVLPYGAESDDWLGLDRRRQQGQRRFLGTRELVGFIEVEDDTGEFQAVSSREGLVNNRAFRELTSDAKDVESVLDSRPTYGYFHRIARKLERFVVQGLDWDRITTNVTSEEELLDPATYSYVTHRQKILECFESIIGLHTRPEHVEDLDVDFRNVFSLAQAETESFVHLVDNLQQKFEGTSVARLTPAEKRNLSKFVARQAKRLAAKESASRRLEQQLQVETKRRLFAEFEQSADVDRILKMHHQTGLLSGKVFKQLDAVLRKYRDAPETFDVAKLINEIERALFDIDKIRKVSEFASKASFNLATNRVTEDIVLFIEEYVDRIQETSVGWNLKVSFDNSGGHVLKRTFRPLELMMLVDNLIDNSGKAKAKHLKISVTGSRDGVSMRFSDDGVGLPSTHNNADLFEKGVTTTSGSGIGLFHVRQIVNDLGGDVRIRNNQAKGACVVVEFRAT